MSKSAVSCTPPAYPLKKSAANSSERSIGGSLPYLPTLVSDIAADTKHGPPSADVSVLVLAMCLVVLDPYDEGKVSIGHVALYGLVKMIFAQVQAIVTTTTYLVQAGVILAAYEYACGRPDAAFVSIGTVARMGQSLGMENYV